MKNSNNNESSKLQDKVIIPALNITGDDGSYEMGSQMVLWLGVQWMRNKPKDIWETTGHSWATCKAEKEFHKLVNKKDTYGLSELQGYGTFTHLEFIHRHGLEKWFRRVGKRNPERIFTIRYTALKSLGVRLNKEVLEKLARLKKVLGIEGERECRSW